MDRPARPASRRLPLLLAATALLLGGPRTAAGLDPAAVNLDPTQVQLYVKGDTRTGDFYVVNTTPWPLQVVGTIAGGASLGPGFTTVGAYGVAAAPGIDLSQATSGSLNVGIDGSADGWSFSIGITASKGGNGDTYWSMVGSPSPTWGRPDGTAVYSNSGACARGTGLWSSAFTPQVHFFLGMFSPHDHASENRVKVILQVSPNRPGMYSSYSDYCK